MTHRVCLYRAQPMDRFAFGTGDHGVSRRRLLCGRGEHHIIRVLSFLWVVLYHLIHVIGCKQLMPLIGCTLCIDTDCGLEPDPTFIAGVRG